MKKINILLLLLLTSSTSLHSQEASTSSASSSTAQTSSNKPKNAAHLLKIPLALEKPASAPDNVIEDNKLYLDLNNQFAGVPFAEFIDDRLAENKPIIFAVTTTKTSGVHTYRIYEAYEICTHFYRDDLSRNRYRITPSQVPLEPTSRQPVTNKIMFFMLYDKNKPVVYIGSDHDLFEGKKDQKSRLKNTLMTNSQTNPDVDLLMNLYHAYEDNLDIAQKYLQQAADRGSVDAMYDLGIFYYMKKNFKLAEQYLKKAADKGNADAMNLLGDLYKKQNKLDLAEKYYKLAADKENLWAMNSLAALYYNQNKFNLAEQYLKKAIDKDDVTAMLKLGMHYYKTNELNASEKQLKLAAGKDSVEAMLMLGKVYTKQNKFDDAEKYLKQAVGKGYVIAMNDLGVLYYSQGKLNLAEHYWQYALRVLQSQPDPKLEKIIRSNLAMLKAKQDVILEKS